MGIGRIFSGAYRRARTAEKRGDLREAARCYLEAGEPALAVSALVAESERGTLLEDRLASLLEARRVAPDPDGQKDLDRRIGQLVLRDSVARGVLSAEERRRLTEAAERLEAAGELRDAASAWELLGRTQDLLRCLESAGDIERLEPLLEAEAERTRVALRVRSLVADHRVHVASGERSKALAALRQASLQSPEDPSIRDMVRELEGRMIGGRTLRLRVADHELVVVGKLPLVLGRGDADLVVRGASVSRRHTSVGLEADELVLRDLDSRNGTLISGVPIRGEVRMRGPVQVGLGDDSAVECARVEDAHGGGTLLRVEVVRGLDRGMCALAAAGSVPLVEVDAQLRFEAVPTLVAVGATRLRLRADEQVLDVARVELLRGDVVEVGDVRIEVIG